MKLTIDTDKLADAAQWALRAVPGNPPIPVMAGMRLEAADNTLALAGFDYYRSARAAEDCEVSEPGTLLVPGRVFTDIVKAFPKDKPTTLGLDGTDLALSCGSAHILLPALPLDDYPTLPTISAASGTVDGPALAAAGAAVAVAACTDETIATLTGVQFGLADTTLTLSATDRYSFHVADMPWTPNPGAKGKGKNKPRVTGNVLVPADAVRDAARILADTNTAELTITESQFAISVPGRWATSSLIDGELPKYAALFPTEFESVATTGTETLTDAIKHIQPLLGKTDPMVLEVTDGQITVRAGTDHRLQPRPAPQDAPADRRAPHAVQLHHRDQARTDVFRGLVMPVRLTSISG